MVPAQSKASYAHDVAFRYLITADQSAHYRSVLLPPFARQFQISTKRKDRNKKKCTCCKYYALNISFDTIFFKRVFLNNCNRLEYFLVRNTIISECIILYLRARLVQAHFSFNYILVCAIVLPLFLCRNNEDPFALHY